MQDPSETVATAKIAPFTRRTLLKAVAVIGGAAPATAILSIPSFSGDSTMTAEQAAEIVRRAYHAFNTADLDLFTTLSTDDFTWETPGTSPRAGLRKGREAVYAQYGAYLSDTDGTFKAELQYVAADGQGRVTGVHRNTGMRGGKKLDSMCCITFEVKNDKIVSGKEHFFDLYNWDQFWS